MRSPVVEATATSREAFVAACRAREHAALLSLAAVVGDRSLCSLSRAGGSVPTAKYHEGVVAASAEARRSVRALSDDPNHQPDVPDRPDPVRVAVLEVRARWQAQREAPGRSGPAWAGYLTGGLDALDQMIDESEGRGVRDTRS